jgi:hypothetical protein
MKVAGFTFIKNAIKYDFPIVEAIQSILPLCDIVIVAVGDSEDDTRSLVSAIDPKVRIIDTIWKEDIKQNGAVLAEETNKAIQEISSEYDWCVYIQGDEVLHENDLNTVKNGMREHLQDDRVDGLLFNYKHFYGSYDYIGSSANWYRHEIRVIKNNRQIYSWRDAQGFRKGNSKILKVKPIQASIYHYGWVKPPAIMFEKVKNDRLVRHGIVESDIPVISAETDQFDYSQIDQLHKFTGSHPKVMQARIKRNNWKFDYDISTNKFTLKEKVKRWSEKLFGFQVGEYKNYRIIK